MGIESGPSFKKPLNNEEEMITESENTEKQESLLSPRELDLYERAKTKMREFCNKYDNSEERTLGIMKKLNHFFQYIDKKILSGEKIEEIKSSIDACSLIQDKDEYLDAVMRILKPILDLKDKHANKIEDAQAKVMNREKGFTEINRLLSYGKHGSTVHIHAPPGETVGNKLGLYREAMERLADIVRNDLDIQEITATSYLVAKHPRLFTAIGFEIGDVPEEFRRGHFADEERQIKKATISRKEFLNKFLKNKSPNK